MRFKIEKIFIKDLTTLLLTLVLFPVFSGAQEPLVVKNLTLPPVNTNVMGGLMALFLMIDLCLIIHLWRHRTVPSEVQSMQYVYQMMDMFILLIV